MKIAILTFHKACNCGALIQAWALKKVLKKMGHEASFPSCIKTGVPIIKWNFNRRRGLAIGLIAACFNSLRTALYNGYLRFRMTSFKYHYIKERRCRAEELSEKYDLLVVGSDQVWNPKCAHPQNYQLNIGILPFGSVPMIGYALSAGDGNVDAGTRKQLLDAVKRFKAVSFRENTLGLQLGIESPIVVCDPSLLLDAKDYDEISVSRRLVKEEYLFAYSATQDPDVLWKIVEIGKRLGLRVIIAQIYSRWFWHKRLPKNSCVGLTPGEMISYLRHAKYVISSSFHGAAVSIANGVQFVHLASNSEPAYSRTRGLLEKIGLKSRFFNSDNSVDEVIKELKLPYLVDLSKWRMQSLAFLESNIKAFTES